MSENCARELQVVSKMKELDIAVSNLSETTDRVMERLKSVSRSNKETCGVLDTAKCPTPATEIVPLAEQINDLINRVRDITRKNDSLLSRLEI